MVEMLALYGSIRDAKARSHKILQAGKSSSILA